MKKFIHLRGSMAVGKTSAAREFVSKGNFLDLEIKVSGKYYPYLYEKERNIVVTGRYNTRVCGGLDGIIKSKDLMIKYLASIIKELNPDYIVFEAVMYGTTVKFAEELNSFVNKYGYLYRGLVFCPPLEIAIQRVFERNGGKQINIDNFVKTYEMSYRSFLVLKEKGYKVSLVDTSKYSKKDMFKIIQKEIE